MHLIVGLGNPGKEYEGTRHNIGWELIDRLAGANRIRVEGREKGVRAFVGTGEIAGRKVMLVKPLTFMNLSGEAVGPLVRRYLAVRREDGTEAPDLSRLLVLSDDTNLPVGRLRLRARGSSGGQNGLKSVAAHLGSQEWARLRLGVGEAPPGLQVDWVLGRFSRPDRKVVDETLITAMGAVEVWLADGIEAAMNRFNPPTPVAPSPPKPPKPRAPDPDPET
jgi:PTH1 family peptidyl-tRNA hydrolase